MREMKCQFHTIDYILYCFLFSYSVLTICMDWNISHLRHPALNIPSERTKKLLQSPVLLNPTP
jgi:hypothetical protein